MKKILFLSLVLFLSACSLKQSGVDNTQKFILTDDNSSFQTSFKNTQKILKILTPETPLYLNSYAIIYIQNGLSNAYAYHFWGDLPSNFYRFVLLSKFEQSGIFKSLVGQSSGILADFILEARLDSFEQILKQNENYAKISLSLNLIDAKKNQILSHKNFKVKENIDKNDIELVLKAFNKALNNLTKDIVFWVGENVY